MDDHLTPIEGWARFRLPYFRIGAVVALAAGILAVGILGPHPDSSATPTIATPATAVAQVPISAAAPSSPASTTAVPAPVVATGIDAIGGVVTIRPAAADVHLSWLPDDITSRSLAAIGSRVFYVTGADRIRSSTIGSDTPPETLVSVPACRAINQVAAAGDFVAYVVTSPVRPPLDSTGCGGPTRIAWSVRLLDLRRGGPREVASGVRDVGSVQDELYPVHLALSATSVAFDRTPTPAGGWSGETVEVRATADGHLQWSTQTDFPVSDVMLGGSTLAVLTAGPQLWTADASHPALRLVANPSSAASISDDGSYLAWDVNTGLGGESEVAVQPTSGGPPVLLVAPTGSSNPEPLRPVVSATPTGPVVAWYATAPGGGIYPAFRNASHGQPAVLDSAQEPAWLHLEGNVLIWVAADLEGGPSLAFAVDVSVAM